MTPNEVLDELNVLTARVKELMEGELFDEGDGTEEYVTSGSEDTFCLMAGKGYCSDVGVLSSVKDTENGYIFYFPSYSSANQENYVCIDYAEAEYMRKLLTYLHKKGQK